MWEGGRCGAGGILKRGGGREGGTGRIPKLKVSTITRKMGGVELYCQGREKGGRGKGRGRHETGTSTAVVVGAAVQVRPRREGKETWWQAKESLQSQRIASDKGS